MKTILLLLSAMFLFSASTLTETVSEQINLFMNIETFDKWINVANILLPFETYHPQGIVKIGDSFFLTAIDGNAAGYLIKFNVTSLSTPATLVRQIQLTDPSFPNRIHPGGIDYDPSTNRVWCPLA